VANYTEELAQVLIESAGLTPLVVSVQTPLPAGEVENTRPRAGAPLLPNDTVRVLVSIGPATVVMPDLSGMTLEQAQDTLDTLGLVQGDFYPADSRAQAPGTIFQQQPPAGTLAAPGTIVTGWYVRENQ
jgi:serine/threonine-protein kinase